MTVHRALGSGFQEVIYQRAPVIEMERAGIDSGRGIEQHIYYLRVKIGSKPVDIIMANRVCGESRCSAVERTNLTS
jgi:GxxExxY protein